MKCDEIAFTTFQKREAQGIVSASSLASHVVNYTLLKNLPQAIHIQEEGWGGSKHGLK